MSDETEVPTGLPEGETVAEQPATENAPETGTEQTPEQQEEEAPKPKHKPWFQERIDQLTREKHDERRAREALEQTIAEMRTADPNAPKPPADLDRMVSERAAEIAETKAFNAKCDDIYSSGAAEFQDFDDVLANFRMLGGLSKPLLDAVTQLPDAHKVLHSLGQNMDEASRILNLPPVPMALELAKLSISPAKTKPVSNAPTPVRPIDGAPKGQKSPDDMSISEWMEWREAHLAKQR